MVKRTSAWVRLTAAAVASLMFGGADDTAAHAAGDDPRAYAFSQLRAKQGDASERLDHGLVYGKRHSVAAVDARAVNKDSPAADSVAGTPDEVDVRTALAADGKTIQVVVALVLPIEHDVVWEVLGDYENMPRFVPDIRATRLIDVKPGKIRVEIEGVARLMFLEFPTSTTLDVVYPGDGSIALDSVAGNLGKVLVMLLALLMTGVLVALYLLLLGGLVTLAGFIVQLFRPFRLYSFQRGASQQDKLAMAAFGQPDHTLRSDTPRSAADENDGGGGNKCLIAHETAS